MQCTNTITEFHWPHASQTSPFMAKIHLYTQQRAIEIVDKFLLDCIECDRFHNKQSEDSGKDEEVEQEESMLEQKFRSALKALVALFCDHPEFFGWDSAKQHLNRLTSIEDHRVVKCHKYLAEIYGQLGEDLDNTVFEDIDLDGLRNRI